VDPDDLVPVRGPGVEVGVAVHLDLQVGVPQALGGAPVLRLVEAQAASPARPRRAGPR
jgi:hypothetical protein